MRRMPCRSLLVAVVSTGLVATAGVCAVPTAHADSAASATLTGIRKSATRVPFQVSPQVSASVDVGTGNLMVSTQDWYLGALNGQLQPLGLAYNSLTLGSGSAATSGEGGRGWFMPFGADTRLIKNDDGSVLFMASDSEQGVFTPTSSGGYTPPATMNKTLTKNSDGTWTVLDVPSLKKMHFTTGGRLDKITDRNGNDTTFTYTSGEVSSIKSGANFYVKVSHDAGGRITAISHWDGPGTASDGATPPSMQYDYDASGRLSKIWQIGHYFVGQLPPTTLEASFMWTSGGDLGSVTDSDDLATAFTYDSSHRVTSVSQGKGSDQAVTRFDYVSSTQTDVADPNTDQSGAVTSVPHTVYTVNSTTKLVSKAVDPLGHSESATYTPFNDVASATNGVGGTTTDSHDSGVNGGHSITQSTAPTGASQSWKYGTGTSAYNPTSATDTQGNTSVMTYDGAGNPTSTTAAGGAKAQIAFNSNGTLASSTDPAGNKTTYTNDSTNKYVTTITPPSGSTLGPTSISGVPTYSVTNGAGQTTNYDYDTLDHVTQSSSPDVTVNYTYSPAERLTSRADNNQKVTYTYDNRGNVASIATTPVAAGAPPASTVSYGYDKAGNMTFRTIGRLDTTRYAYDSANRLTSMTTPDGQVTRFAYDGNDHRTDTWWHTNATHSTFAAHTHNDFDKSGRLTRTWTSRNSSDSTRIFDSTYSYAKSSGDTGLIQSVTDNLPSSNKVTTLAYDSQNRLTGATNWHGVNYTYKYDSNGNRTTTTAGGSAIQSLSFNHDNEISSSGYAYDKAGRRTKDRVGGTMTYNTAGQMTKQVVGSGTDTFRFAGDTQDELIQQSTSGTVTNYSYGRANQAGVPALEQYTQTGVTTTFDNDAAGQPIDWRAAGTDYYFVYDGLGQFIADIKGDGTQNGSNLTPTPWGNLNLGGSGTPAATNTVKSKLAPAASAGGSEAPWTTVGIANQIVNPTTWWLRGARWNDTGTGTWTTTDPITRLNDPNRANPYTFAGDDPINNIDPAGRDILDDLIGGIAGLGITAACEALTVGTGSIGCGVAGVIGGVEVAAGLDYLRFGETPILVRE